MRRSSSTSLSSSTRSSPPPAAAIHDDRAANPTVLRTHAATRRATRRSRRASRRPTQLRRDPTLRSRLTEPTARPTPLNRRASDALRAFAPAQAAHPHALASKPSRGWSTFQPAQAGPSPKPALTRGEGLPDEALRAATRSAPRSSRSRLHREGGSIFERRKGVNFRAALTPVRRCVNPTIC